ncbi:unnamed protein product [Ilex paraguariensis]|uniref:C2 NT-type domain-containing protein n=1 Tax=Ilex paraguariensis TaxID=185542 RepID=A0ABC8RL73_9AQUA
MVLGLKNKNRKSPSVQVDYLIHVQEIKPWPPSQSLRTLRSALIQWEHGEKNSGSTNHVAPSLGTGAGVGDGRIEFNESFRLPVTLLREMSIKGGDGDTFQKNCVEFHLYEPRRDKTVKGQLLGTAIVNLADYGVIKESLSISFPINCKRSYSNTAQPVLFLKIQPVEKSRTSFSSRDSLMRETLMDGNRSESVSALMNEEYADEAEIASLTDDDVSSHSSMAFSSSAIESNAGSPYQKEENGSEAMKDSPGEAIYKHVVASKQGLAKLDETPVNVSFGSLKDGSSCSSSTDLSSELAFFSKKISGCRIQSSSSSIDYEGTDKELNRNTRSNDQDDLAQDIQENVADVGNGSKGAAQQSNRESRSNEFSTKVASPDEDTQVDEKLGSANSVGSQLNGEDDGKAWTPSIKSASADFIQNGSVEDKKRQRHQENGQERRILEEENHYIEDKTLSTFPQDDSGKQVSLASAALSVSRDNLIPKLDVLNGDRLKLVKSVRSPMDSSRSNGSVRSNPFMEKVKDVSVQEDTQNIARNTWSNGKKDSSFHAKETRNIISDSKIQKLEQRVKMLEGELREAAAIEVGLYSVIAEHGSSVNKVHAPARRLFRLYLHAYKEKFQSRRASVARSAVSGLVLVAKACGNDVPRLTFWLSNSIVLRAIMSQAFGERQAPLSAGSFVKRNGDWNENKKKNFPLKWGCSPNKETRSALHGSSDDWEDPHTFTIALEKIEAWIFSRIIESIWWQTLTPHMQSAAAKAIHRSISSDMSKIYRRTSGSDDQEQGNFSLELWKKAFGEACERICPVRAGGHECGCLPVLARLIMEQCVMRLDIAMFNAILRESADEIPTDPVSDPISDAKVLPIPAGKASFGAGALLKNAIGNWSRWLTDLFGIEDDDSLEDEDGPDNTDADETKECDTSFKSFHLLNALSDLMMLPKDMLLSRSIRKEVCPTFGAPLIRRVLSTFVPDEFCPDPIPEVVLKALNSEDPFEAEETSVINFPCAAAPLAYRPPSGASLAGILGDIGSQTQLTRSRSSVLKKSYTSDDELDELDSPLTSITFDKFQPSPTSTKSSWISKENGSRNAVRYQLLREVWINSE